MMTMKLSTWPQRAIRGCGALGALLATQAALAVGNLPGGPAVNQINLAPPVTRIATDIQWLHEVMLVICLLIFMPPSSLPLFAERDKHFLGEMNSSNR